MRNGLQRVGRGRLVAVQFKPNPRAIAVVRNKHGKTGIIPDIVLAVADCRVLLANFFVKTSCYECVWCKPVPTVAPSVGAANLSRDALR